MQVLFPPTAVEVVDCPAVIELAGVKLQASISLAVEYRLVKVAVQPYSDCLPDFWCWLYPRVPNGRWHDCLKITETWWVDLNGDCTYDIEVEVTTTHCTPLPAWPWNCC